MSTKGIIQIRRELASERQAMLALPPEKALDQILQHPQPAALVHSFPEEDLFLLIQDIGAEDALPLLSLASNRQWEFMLDMESWQRDRMDTAATTKWLALLLEADQKRFVKWVFEEKTQFVQYYLFRNMQLRIRAHDEDPSDFGDGFITHDDMFYIRFTEAPEDVSPNEPDNPAQPDKSGKPETNTILGNRKEFLARLLERLCNADYLRYQGMLLWAANIIPAETEEEMYRLRSIRLAEKGFLPFDEAFGIYQHLRPADLTKQPKKHTPKASAEPYLPVPFYMLKMMTADNRFSEALTVIQTDEILPQIQLEFAALCNQIIAADQKKITDRRELKGIVEKACAYISIGLERFSKAKPENRAQFMAAMLQKHLLVDIFRVGYGNALELKWQAEKWRQDSWITEQGLALSFYGQKWVGVLGGLLIKKPAFFDDYQTGVLYREFKTLSEIRKTQSTLHNIIAFDGLLGKLNIKDKNLPQYGFLTYKSLLLTLWARNRLGLSDLLEPIALKTFKPFFKGLWASGAKPRRIDITAKESLLNWLCERCALTPSQISAAVGSTLNDLFDEIESEFDRVSVKNLDPRFVNLFLLQT